MSTYVHTISSRYSHVAQTPLPPRILSLSSISHTHYCRHSLRIGAATSACCNGPEHFIQVMGQWSSQTHITSVQIYSSSDLFKLSVLRYWQPLYFRFGFLWHNGFDGNMDQLLLQCEFTVKEIQWLEIWQSQHNKGSLLFKKSNQSESGNLLPNKKFSV